jgi:hypothetical protein
LVIWEYIASWAAFAVELSVNTFEEASLVVGGGSSTNFLQLLNKRVKYNKRHSLAMMLLNILFLYFIKQLY